MRFLFCRNRDSVKNGILISIRRTGDGFHPGLFTQTEAALFISATILDCTSNLQLFSIALLQEAAHHNNNAHFE